MDLNSNVSFSKYEYKGQKNKISASYFISWFINHLSRKSFWKNVSMVAVLFMITSGYVYSQTVQPYIRVDQFGYRPGDKKVAVLADPQVGFNDKDEFIPGAKYQIKSTIDHSIVFEGSPVVWNNGKTCTQSGDRGWWFDFSEVSDTGTFYVYDVEKNLKSYSFDIRPDIYKNMLKAATKMFYYQRLGIEKDAKYVGEKWADGYQQPMDSVCRDIFDKNNPEKIRDMRGGWMDAGDQNKYTTFTVQPVHQLLNAYRQNPSVFTDDFDIPESGNGIPDIIDEVKWQLDWLKRMQDTIDGGAYIKMGGKVTFPLSKDKEPKYYFSPKSTAATIVVSSMMAHAYLVYKDFPELYHYALDCKKRAIQAWEFFHNTPMNFDIDDGSLGGGRANRNQSVQDAEALVAAIYLFAATGDQLFHDYILNNYKTPDNWGIYENHRTKALLFYAFLPNADKDLSAKIISQKKASFNSNSGGWTKFNDKNDLYRAYMPDHQYHWGSNQPKANVGNTLTHFLNYYLLPENHSDIESHALEFLHYFHGVNPVGITYLTNMEGFGAEKSAKFAWHKWFNPHHCPPGYIPGGPNKFYKIDPSYPGDFSPPQNQPHQKSFRDWVEDWRTYPWEITEPAIYYQAAYVYLVSNFAMGNGENIVLPDSIKILYNPIDTLNIGVKTPLSVRFYPLASSLSEVKWESSNSNVAEIDSLGNVNPINVGELVIKAIAENGVSDSLVLSVRQCTSRPYLGMASPIPGIIESEFFDIGCNTYFDNDELNSGNALRITEGVDVEVTNDTIGTYNVGWIYPGEWLTYSVEVKETDIYVIECRAGAVKEAKLNVEFNDGAKLLKPIVLPNSNGYQNWFSTYSDTITLTSGAKKMTVTFLTDGFNINYLNFKKYVPLTFLNIEMDSLLLVKDEEFKLNLEMSGEVGAIEDVVWSSSNKRIVSVKNGKVKALKPGAAYVKVEALVGEVSDSVYVEVVSKTAVKSELQTVLSIYPNPVIDGSFTIRCNIISDDVTVNIYNLMGKKVFDKQIQINEKQSGLIEPSLKAGLYVVKIINGTESHVAKLFIK